MDSTPQPPGSDKQHDTPPGRAGSPRGAWVVAVMLLLGAVAGTASVSYWGLQGKWMRERDAEQDAGPDVWDEPAARVELQQLQEQFNQLASKKGQTDHLITEIQRFVERYPKYAQGRILLAQAMIHDEQYEQAYEQFNLSLELDGQQPEVQLLAGTLAYKLDRLNDAVRHYSMAVGLAPANPRYRLHLAQVYLRQRQDEQARNELLAALRADSSMHEAYAALAQLYAQQNKITLALAQTQKAVEHTPVSEPAKRVQYLRHQTKLLLRDNRPQEALLTLESLTPDQRAQPQVMADMATCWSMLDQPDRAAQLYEQAAAANPTRWRLVAMATSWRLKANDVEAARAHLATLTRLRPQAPEVQELRAVLEQAALQPATNTTTK